jgi:hypothetical protein
MSAAKVRPARATAAIAKTKGSISLFVLQGK